MDFESALQNVLHRLGPWHWFCLFIISVTQTFWNPNVTALAFIGQNPGFSCHGVKTPEPCEVHPPCRQYDYADNFTSIVTEWDLVCAEAYKVSFAQEILMFGFLLGVVILGAVSDSYGRLKTIMGCLYISIVFQSAMLVCHNYAEFVVSRFFLGFCAGGSSLTSYVILMENILSSQRALAGTITMIAFALGNVTFSIMAYFIRSWRLLSLAVAVSSMPFVLLTWIIPESPRWLCSKGQLSKAEDILYTFGKIGNPKLTKQMVSLTATDEPVNLYGTFDSLKTPELRKRTLVLMFAWFTASFVYYGLTMNASSQGSNMYISFALSGLVEVPAHILCLFTLNWYGRRRTLIMAYVIGGISCFGVNYVTVTGNEFLSPLILSLIGKMGISIAFNAIYLFSLELLPTVIRNGAMGLCSMAARIGGIIAPMLATYGDDVSFFGFGLASALSALLMLMLPETLNKPLPETIDDIEITTGGDKKGVVQRKTLLMNA